MTFDLKKDGKRIVVICIAAVIMAVNTKTFIRTGGLYPGGVMGLTILIQAIFENFFNMQIPFSVVNLLLNLLPIYIGFRFIGKKFTLYSCLMIVLSSILTDIIPANVITYDTLLISIFGGIISGCAISLCLMMNATTGGTDFLAIYLSEKRVWIPGIWFLASMPLLFRWQAFYSVGIKLCIPLFSSMLPPRCCRCCTKGIKNKRYLLLQINRKMYATQFMR